MIMRRKAASLILLVCSAAALFYLLGFRERTSRLSEYMVSEAEFKELMETRSISQELFIEEIEMNEKTLFFDRSSDTFFYSLTEGEPYRFDPYTTISCGTGLRVAVREGEISRESMQNNQTIEVMIYDEDSYRLYGLKCTALPLLGIRCEGELTEEPVGMTMELLDNRADTTAPITRSNGTIHIRGNSTKKYPKKGFRLSLTLESAGENTRSNMVSLLGMRQDDDWVLYAAYNDQEKIRNVFSSNLWSQSCSKNNSWGLDLGMEYRYVELFMNGEYCGLYALGYPVDGKQAGIDEDAGEYLYKKTDWANSIALTFNETGNLNGYEISEGLQNGSRWEALKAFHGLFSGEEADTEALYESVDIGNAVDQYIFLNLIQGMDHVSESSLKNVYMAAKKHGESSQILFIPWDMDLTWGNKWQYVSQNYTLPYETPAKTHYIMESGVIYRLLLNKDEEICQKIVERYRELRSGPWSDQSILSMLDVFEEEIYGSGAFLRDRERWPEGTYGDPEAGLSVFRDFVLERLYHTDIYYDTLETMQGRNIYLIRTAQYENFRNDRFLIEIHNRQLLEEQDIMELLEYMGVDITKIKGDVTWVAVNGETGQADYIGSLQAGDTVKTCAGLLQFRTDPEIQYDHPDDCDIYLDGELCFRYQPSNSEEIRMKIIDEEERYDFRFKK